MTKAIDTMIKEFGKAVLRKGSDIPKLDKIPSGVVSLDMLLKGGWPRKRVVELYGPESSGKSTLATLAIAEAQRAGLAALYVDLERTYDPKYAAVLGVDSNMILAPTFKSGEQAIDGTEYIINNWKEIAEKMEMPKELGIIVIDSIAALLPEAEINSDIGDNHVGLVGRMMSRMSRKFTPILDNANVCMMYINQLRATISSAPFAPKTCTTGGNAIKYYATLRVDVRRIGQIKHGDDRVGANVRIMLNKDKVTGNELKSTTVEMYHGKGISTISDIIKLSLDKGLTKQAGAWYTYKEERFQGKDSLKEYLFNNPEVLQQLKEEVLNDITKD